MANSVSAGAALLARFVDLGLVFSHSSGSVLELVHKLKLSGLLQGRNGSHTSSDYFVPVFPYSYCIQCKAVTIVRSSTLFTCGCARCYRPTDPMVNFNSVSMLNLLNGQLQVQLSGQDKLELCLALKQVYLNRIVGD